MISREIQKKLLGIIRDNMIPEYENSLVCKEKIKEEFIRYLENDCFSEEDLELISKYPEYIKKTKSVPIIFSYTSEIDMAQYNSSMYGLMSLNNKLDLEIKLDKEYPAAVNCIYTLKEKDKDEWIKISPFFYKFINFRNLYVKKLNMAFDFLSHKNTTITLIKNKFPELYKLYKQ